MTQAFLKIPVCTSANGGAVDLVKFCGILSDMLRAQAGAQAGAGLYITGKLLELLSELYYVYQTYGGEAPRSACPVQP